MNKYVFLFELRRHLSYMTPGDKESAAHYYEEYFAEAGPENEQAIIEELGPPERLAAELRREYDAGRPEPTGRELATGNEREPRSPFGDAKVRSPLGNDPYSENEEQKVPPSGQGAPRDREAPRGGAAGPRSQSQGARRPYGSAPEHAPPYGSYRYGSSRNGRPAYGSRAAGGEARRDPPPPRSDGETGRRKKLSGGMIALLVIAIVCLGPVVFGLAVAAVSVVFALCAALLSVAVAAVAAGAAAIYAGMRALGHLPDAALMFGLGLTGLAFGLPLFWLFVWSSAKLLRGTVRGIKNIWRKIISGIGGAAA